MSALGIFLIGLSTDLVNFFLRFFTKKVALSLVAVSVLAALTASFYAGLEALTSSLTVVTPTAIQIAASWIVPSNTSVCLAAVGAARLARFAYDWQSFIVTMKLDAS